MHACCDHPTHDGCSELPSFERVCYYMGQLLGPDEFIAEHQFFADKLALIVSKLIGHGVVCGLDVTVECPPPDPCAPPTQDQLERAVLTIQPGLAVDCDGQLLIVRERLTVALWPLLCPSDREAAKRITEGSRPPLWLSLRFAERAAGMRRPVRTDPCAVPSRTHASRVRECVEIVVGLDRPAESECDECCDSCSDPRVLLGVMRQVVTECVVECPVVDESMRRSLARTKLAVIDGITWVHGATYDCDKADELFEQGIAVHFSRPVLVETLRDPGIVDVVVHAGGRGNSDSYIPRSVEVSDGEVTLEPGETDPVTGTTRELWIRYDGGDRLDPGDRVRISVRCDFILDVCCRAVDGNHIGGRVPTYVPTWSASGTWVPIDCTAPPPMRHCGRPQSTPWTSGNGTEGGTFESWITMRDRGAKS